MRQALAVLIDAENISSVLFEPLHMLINALGNPIVWQLHGDFFSWPHPGWQEVAHREGIELRHQFHAGKNSADIAMTIAAMDLLAARRVQAFCLVSSDSDFTPLVRRLRSDNIPVSASARTRQRTRSGVPIRNFMCCGRRCRCRKRRWSGGWTSST